MIEFESYLKRYGTRVILEVPKARWDNGLHLLVGPNGGGKTTLLRSLAGMIPFRGKLRLDENIELPKQVRLQRQLINHVAAEPLFADFLTGDHLVAFFLKLKNGQPEQITEAREWLKIGDYLSQKVGTYSTGMKKKLALLLACLGNPRWLLLDEPFIGLDPEAKEGLLNLIQAKRAAGINLALASHQPIVLEQLQPTACWRIDEGQMEPLTQAKVKYWLQRILAEEI